MRRIVPLVLAGIAAGCGGQAVEYADDAAFRRFLRPLTLEPPLPKGRGLVLHSLDRDAAWCASAWGAGDEVVLWRVGPSPRPDLRVRSPRTWGLRLSPDRRWLYTYELMEKSRLFWLGTGAVPAPGDPIPMAGYEPTFLADGHHLVVLSRGTSLYRLDGSTGTVRPHPIVLSAQEKLRATPDGKHCYVLKKTRGKVAHFRLVKIGSQGLVPGADLGELDSGERIEAVDPQGRWAVLRSGSLLRIGGRNAPESLEAGGIERAVFTPTGRDLITVREGGTARRWSLDGSRYVPVSLIQLSSVVQDLSWPDAGKAVLFAYRDGPLMWRRVDGESHRVRIGGDGIVWRNTSKVRPRDRAPRLRLSAKWRSTKDGVAVRLILANTGTSDAEGVVGRIEADPPLPEPIRIFFGTVRADGTVERRVRIPLDRKHRDHVVAFTATAWAPFVVDPFPARWLRVPAGTTTPEAYRSLAESIVATSGGLLQQVLGRPVSAKVVLLDPDQVGFMGPRNKVLIQDHHRLTDNAFAQIRRIFDANTHEEVARWGDVLLRFYVPHEMVHVADGGRAGWRAEYIANMVQPYLVLSTLAAMGVPWDEGDLRRLIRHVERVTRPRIPDRYVAGIEAFLARNGEGDALDITAWQLFRSDPASYVWFGLRVNLESLARRSNLKEIATRLIR